MVSHADSNASSQAFRTQHNILLNKLPGDEVAVEVAVVFFPAKGIDGEVYGPLLHIIQATAHMFSINMHVAIVKPESEDDATQDNTSHTPNPTPLPTSQTDEDTRHQHQKQQQIKQQHQQLQNALSDLRDVYSFDAAAHQVVLAGHADGARAAQEVAASPQHAQRSTRHDQDQKQEQRAFVQPHKPIAAVISYCCLPQRCFIEANYPVPLLTVLGARDGLVRLSQAAEIFRRLADDFPDNEMRAQRVPVSVYPAFSHRWFSLGAGTPHINSLDLSPPTPTTIAPRELGYMTSMFLHVCCPDSKTSVTPLKPPRHFNFIRNAAAADFLYLAPYRNACANDRHGYTCAKAQSWLLGNRSDSDPPPKEASLAPHARISLPAGSSEGKDSKPTLKLSAEGTVEGFAKDAVFVSSDSVRVYQPRTFRAAPVAADSAVQWGGCGGNRTVGWDGGCGDGSEEEQFRGVAAGVFSEGSCVVVWSQVRLRGAHYTEDPLTAPSQSAAATLHCKLASRCAVRAAVKARARQSAQHGASGASETRESTQARDGDSDAHAVRCAQSPAARDEYAAARLNEEVLLTVLQKLPEHVRASYACVPGRLQFGADIIAPCITDWLNSDLVFENLPSDEHSEASEQGGVLLRAVCFESTPVGTGAEVSDPGTFCCTLLSETQAYEYILYESQREGASAQHKHVA